MAEDEIERLEQEFPLKAAAAFAAARKRALEAGQTLVEAHGDELVEISPDGTRKVLKKIAPPTKVTKGQIIMLR